MIDFKLSSVKVSVIVSVIFLLVACTARNNVETTSTPAVTATATRADVNVVEVTVDKTVYKVGECVHYSITNHGDKPVYYGEGHCDIPFIIRLEDGREEQLAIYILEEEIPILRLAADESLSCKWSQRAYSGEGVDFGNHQVPPGQYQVKFPYAFEEAHVSSQALTIVAESQVFTIE